MSTGLSRLSASVVRECSLALRRLVAVFTVAAFTIAPMVAAAATPTARVRWTVNVGQPVYNTPRVRDGVVYLDTVQPSGPNVFAVKHGKILWKFATGGAITTPVTLSGSQLFVASDIGPTHYMRALDTKSGQLIWDYTRDQPPECMCSHKTHYLQSVLIAQTDGHSFYAFRPDGTIPSRRVWVFRGDGARLTAPVIVGDIVLFGSADDCLYALNSETGKIRWRKKTGYSFTAPPTVIGNMMVAGNRGGNIYAFAVGTGKTIWTAATNGPIDTPPVVYRSKVFIAAGAGDRGIYALSVSTGRQLWYHQMADYTNYAPVILDKTLIVASRDGNAVGIDPDNGQILWTTDLHGMPFSRPVVDGNAVVIKVGDHRLVKIRAKTGRVLWSYHTASVITSPVVESRQSTGTTASTPATVYIGTSTGKVLALEGTPGQTALKGRNTATVSGSDYSGDLTGDWFGLRSSPNISSV